MSGADQLDLSIIIVSFNTRDLLRNCLRSVYAHIAGLSFEVIVVDNSSSDGSAEMVKNEFPNSLLIESNTNAGFANANNLAFEKARGRYVLLLNSDTVMQMNPLPVIEYLDKNNHIGILGCRIIYGNGTLQKSAWRFPTLFQEWYSFSGLSFLRRFIPVFSELKFRGIDYKKITEVDCVSGCCLFVRSGLLNLIGALDEHFFMYYEDTEFCYRSKRQTGYKTVYYPDYRVIHYHGMSGNFLKATLLSFDSARYYFSKTRSAAFSCFFVQTCKMAWYFNLSILSMVNFFVRNERIKEQINLFRQLLSITRLRSDAGKGGHDNSEVAQLTVPGCK